MGLSWKVAAMSQGYEDAGGTSEYRELVQVRKWSRFLERGGDSRREVRRGTGAWGPTACPAPGPGFFQMWLHLDAILGFPGSPPPLSVSLS